MTTLREAAQQALEALGKMYTPRQPKAEDFDLVLAAITALRAALAQQQEQEADYPEEKLQAVAEYVSNQYHVWYGVAARDIEEVLRQSVRCGLVSNPPRREWQELSNGEIYAAYITATNQTLRPQDERLALAFARAIEAALKERNT
jgi:hypothetical protein